MKNIAIIGHGPSLLNVGLGLEIDSYDIVIRQKAVSHSLVHKLPNDYGIKTSVICGSYTIKEALFWHPAAKVWVFVDSRHEKIIPPQDNRFTLLYNLCLQWNQIYRDLRTENYTRDKRMTIHSTSSDSGHNHMSCGLHTILYACEILKPKNITLFGFDNVNSGNFTWSVTRGQTWSEYPDHRWDIESQMISLIENEYSVRFLFK